MTPEDIHFPEFQGHCVNVSVINGARSHMLAEMLVHPAPVDKKYLDLAGYSFLIESRNRGQKVLYDLAFMKDLENRMPPALKAMFTSNDVMGIDEFQHVPDTIKAQGVHLSEINSIIWSHAHIDHVGDPSVFPSTTELVVGPGLKANYIPGYPTNPNAFVLDSAFEGRTVREIDFAECKTTIGGFRAADFFGDGSFWILEAPGHTSHHICALCRTTEDSWLLLGGDACHSIAQLRPNSFRPLPETVSEDSIGRLRSEESSCNHTSSACHRSREQSIYNLAPAMAEDLKMAEETVEKFKAFDGRDDVMIILAHDATLLDSLEFFPESIADWKAKDKATQGRWLFLKDLKA
jgi:glyoxylase-like metal-dependent hydrolase (beta-lactamase superfamily II)